MKRKLKLGSTKQVPHIDAIVGSPDEVCEVFEGFSWGIPFRPFRGTEGDPDYKPGKLT